VVHVSKELSIPLSAASKEVSPPTTQCNFQEIYNAANTHSGYKQLYFEWADKRLVRFYNPYEILRLNKAGKGGGGTSEFLNTLSASVLKNGDMNFFFHSKM
jgi:hypothetical protein